MSDPVADEIEQYPSSYTNYTTGVAHALLCGASGWAIHKTSFEKSPFAYGTFAFLLGHGLLGILKHTHPGVLKYVKCAYSYSTIISTIAPISLLNTQLYIDYKQPDEFIYTHPVSIIVPVLGECLLPATNDKILDVIMVGNLCSLGYISTIKENYWAIGLTILLTLNHFILGRIGNYFNVPKTDLVTIGLGFFVIFAVNCLEECY